MNHGLFLGLHAFYSVRLLQFNLHLIQMPDIFHVLLDGTVRAELTAACGVEHSCLCPSLLVTVCFIYTLLRICIHPEILQDKVGVSAVTA